MENKSRLKTKIIFIIIILIFTGSVVFITFQNFYRAEEKRLQDCREKQYFMLILKSEYLEVYTKPEYDEKYWNEFLQDRDVINRLRYVNQYMDEIYPNSPYIKITSEDLAKNYNEIYELWSKEMNNYLEYEKKYETDKIFSDVVIKAGVEGWRRDVINFLGFDELTQNYDYDTTYTDLFLKQKYLENFLSELNQYMKEYYPGIEFEEITMERLQKMEYDVCDQLWDVTEELQGHDVDFSEIVEQIHDEMDSESL